MKRVEEKNRKTKISIAMSPEILEKIDDKTSNRSSLINWLLREHFAKNGEDVSKIKL